MGLVSCPVLCRKTLRGRRKWRKGGPGLVGRRAALKQVEKSGAMASPQVPAGGQRWLQAAWPGVSGIGSGAGSGWAVVATPAGMFFWAAGGEACKQAS